MRPTLRMGRPRETYHEYDRRLADVGGIDRFLLARYDDHDTSRAIADKLDALTGIRVTDQAIRNWLRAALAKREQQQQEQAAA